MSDFKTHLYIHSLIYNGEVSRGLTQLHEGYYHILLQTPPCTCSPLKPHTQRAGGGVEENGGEEAGEEVEGVEEAEGGVTGGEELKDTRHWPDSGDAGASNVAPVAENEEEEEEEVKVVEEGADAEDGKDDEGKGVHGAANAETGLVDDEAEDAVLVPLLPGNTTESAPGAGGKHGMEIGGIVCIMTG